MSNAPAAFKATFADWRTVKGRKQLQLIFEVPLEQQGQVLSILGAPNPSNPAWCGVALLDLKAAETSQGASAPVNHDDGIRPPKNVRRDWKQLSYAEQAALRGQDRAFQTFLFEHHMMKEDEYRAGGEIAELAAAKAVRVACGVNSRANLLPNTEAGRKWNELSAKFTAWQYAP